MGGDGERAAHPGLARRTSSTGASRRDPSPPSRRSTRSRFVLTGSGEPVRLIAAAVSWTSLRPRVTPMAMGRDFLQEEDQPGRNRVAILAHATWVDRFGGRPDILGKTVTLSDTSYTVVGVLPPEFEFVAKAADFQARTRFDVWVPLALTATPSRGSHPLRVFARLSRPTLEQAQADVSTSLGVHLARAYPEENKGRGIRAVALRQQVTADVRRRSFSARRRSISSCDRVRQRRNLCSPAAPPVRRKRRCVSRSAPAARRIAQQFLVESTLLGLLGGSIGLALALAMTRVAVPYLPPDLSRAAGVAIDWRVLIFTAVISLATGVLFGLAPLFQARRRERQRVALTRDAGGGWPADQAAQLARHRPDGGHADSSDRCRPHGQELVGTSPSPTRIPDRSDPDGARHVAEGALSERRARRRHFNATCSSGCEQSRRGVCRGNGISTAQRRRQRMGRAH